MVKPLRDYIAVRREEAKDMTDGGIYIPESAKEKPQIGTVVAIGAGKRLDDGAIVPLDVKVGDRIMFSRNIPHEITVDGEPLVFIKEASIIGHIEA